MAGRPSKFTQAIADTICERIARGESLRKIEQSDDMPDAATVYRWLADDRYASFREQYAHARERQADFYADECIAIADDKSQDILEMKDGMDVRTLTNSTAVARAKLQVDARKWKASQLAPKKWGQQQVQHTGEGGGPLQINLNINLKKIKNVDD